MFSVPLQVIFLKKKISDDDSLCGTKCYSCSIEKVILLLLSNEISEVKMFPSSRLNLFRAQNKTLCKSMLTRALLLTTNEFYFNFFLNVKTMDTKN